MRHVRVVVLYADGRETYVDAVFVKPVPDLPGSAVELARLVRVLSLAGYAEERLNG